MVPPDRIIAEVAKRHNVLLDPQDPVLIIATMLELHAADHEEREQRLAARDEKFAKSMQKLLADAKAQASGELTTRTLDELPIAIRKFTTKAFWGHLMIAAGIAAGVLVLGIGGGWWARGTSDAVEIRAAHAGDIRIQDGLSGALRLLTPLEAAHWTTLINLNHDMLAGATCPTDQRYCVFKLWVTPPPAPASPPHP